MYTLSNRSTQKPAADSWLATDWPTRLLTFLTDCAVPGRPFLTLFLLGWHLAGQAQDTAPSDRLSTTMVANDRVDIAALTTADLIVINNGVRRYITNTKLAHQGVLLFSDQAVHELGTSVLNGSGHVLLVQGDTITIQADSMQYNAATRQATLLGRVLFQDRRTLLTTLRLDYTLSAGAFCYTGQSRFTDDKHTITSEGGCYDVRTGRPTAQPGAAVASSRPLSPPAASALPVQATTLPPRPASELKPAEVNKPASQPVVLSDAPVASSGHRINSVPGKTLAHPLPDGPATRPTQVSAKRVQILPTQSRSAAPVSNESDLERMLNRRPRPSTVSNLY